MNTRIAVKRWVNADARLCFTADTEWDHVQDGLGALANHVDALKDSVSFENTEVVVDRMQNGQVRLTYMCNDVLHHKQLASL